VVSKLFDIVILTALATLMVLVAVSSYYYLYMVYVPSTTISDDKLALVSVETQSEEKELNSELSESAPTEELQGLNSVQLDS
jgi:hypothetical protein